MSKPMTEPTKAILSTPKRSSKKNESALLLTPKANASTSDLVPPALTSSSSNLFDVVATPSRKRKVNPVAAQVSTETKANYPSSGGDSSTMVDVEQKSTVATSNESKSISTEGVTDPDQSKTDIAPATPKVKRVRNQASRKKAETTNAPTAMTTKSTDMASQSQEVPSQDASSQQVSTVTATSTRPVENSTAPTEPKKRSKAKDKAEKLPKSVSAADFEVAKKANVNTNDSTSSIAESSTESGDLFSVIAQPHRKSKKKKVFTLLLQESSTGNTESANPENEVHSELTDASLSQSSTDSLEISQSQPEKEAKPEAKPKKQRAPRTTKASTSKPEIPQADSSNSIEQLKVADAPVNVNEWYARATQAASRGELVSEVLKDSIESQVEQKSIDGAVTPQTTDGAFSLQVQRDLSQSPFSSVRQLVMDLPDSEERSEAVKEFIEKFDAAQKDERVKAVAVIICKDNKAANALIGKVIPKTTKQAKTQSGHTNYGREVTFKHAAIVTGKMDEDEIALIVKKVKKGEYRYLFVDDDALLCLGSISDKVGMVIHYDVPTPDQINTFDESTSSIASLFRTRCNILGRNINWPSNSGATVLRKLSVTLLYATGRCRYFAKETYKMLADAGAIKVSDYLLKFSQRPISDNEESQ